MKHFLTRSTRIVFVALLLSLFLLRFFNNIAGSPQVDVWSRYVLSFVNNTYSGNPFEVRIDATFTHLASGTQITLPGYFDGNDTWKVGFMPTKSGTWTYTTSSPAPELNSQTGSLSAVDSSSPGMLKADTSNSRKWKFTNGDYVVPIALRMEFFSEPATLNRFTQVADYMKQHNVHLAETRLTEQYGQWDGRHDYIFSGNWQDHQFDLEIWQRFEQRLDVLAKRGLGAHIMFYSDDKGTPKWGARSATEEMVIRYTIARTAGFPVIWYNTGIDISEYRTCEDINWFGEQIREMDPYGHPVSSRYGGGSGSCIMPGQTFNSQGFNLAKIDRMILEFNNFSVPTSMDDAWGENRDSHPNKNHTEHDIRRAFWKAMAAGGVGGLIRGGGNGGCYNGFMCISHLENEWESEQWLKFINPFLLNYLGDTFGTMVPDTDISDTKQQVYAISDPGKTKLLFLFIGPNDTYNPYTAGIMSVRLKSIAGTFSGIWFDTRTGKEFNAGTFYGGQDYTLTPPTDDDWILYLHNSPTPTQTTSSDPTHTFTPTSTTTPTLEPTPKSTSTPTTTPTPEPSETPTNTSTPSLTPTPLITTDTLQTSISLPDTTDWHNLGISIEEGIDGEWDRYIWGGFANSLIKKGNTYYHFYQGSPSYDTSCESVAYRAIGVATSTDAVNWTKYAGNPVISWTDKGSIEEGAVSSAIWVGSDGRFYIDYGANSGSGCTVNANGRLAVSDDGFTFTDLGQVISQSDPNVWGSGDEIFPVGVYEYQGMWNVFYIPNGVSNSRNLGVISGDSPTSLSISEGVNGGKLPAWGPVSTFLNGTSSLLFVNEPGPNLPIKAYRFNPDAPSALSLEKTYSFDDCALASVIFEPEHERWLMLCMEIPNYSKYFIKSDKPNSFPISPPSPDSEFEVSITYPSDEAEVSGIVSIRADASAEGGVVNVEFYINRELVESDHIAPYEIEWDSTTVENGIHTITVKAYDNLDQETMDSVLVSVQNGDNQQPTPTEVSDTEAPSAPTNLIASAISPNQIELKWDEAADKSGVKGYDIYRDGVSIAFVRKNSYEDTDLQPSTTYSYWVEASDQTGNTSEPSNTASATTQAEISSGTLTGTIFSPDGGTLSGVAVTTSLKNMTKSIISDSDGVYMFPDLSPGIYQVKFIGPSEYKQSIIKVRIDAGITTVLDVTLEKKRK
jgi:hypothetical protein